MPILREKVNGSYVSLTATKVDLFGNKLEIGDLVAHSGNGYGIVTRVTKAGARVQEFGSLDLGNEYNIQDVDKAQRWHMPAWTCDKMVKCMTVQREIVEVLPSQDFVVKYTMNNGFHFFAKFDVSYMGEIV
ncbi:hypothetical protein phiAS5_ORF0049 [Aeromonas phage phiAS5]|uniref:Uncharacterized protein n=1 Tax=Aeromonas phage phiAS5 TaxID=879630 RepID=E1A2E6_9CAUD|nr:hypothetical protein phiAS5_ORF0049 [Aeromonas phage phiAS5]ADM79892.1 hypothetical protein phiAS5_ORF0049 [Aeromonas phage phiAS5]BES53339.1 hypothetical protein [Aeromonas phage phiWae14]